MRVLLLIILACGFLKSPIKAQIHWLINEDSIPNCKLLQGSKFVNKETDERATPGYSIQFTDKEVVEKMEDGKFFVKSKIKYTSPCNYTLTVSETNSKSHQALIGTNVYTEILETATHDNLVKIRSRSDGEWQTFVFEKIMSKN